MLPLPWKAVRVAWLRCWQNIPCPLPLLLLEFSLPSATEPNQKDSEKCAAVCNMLLVSVFAAYEVSRNCAFAQGSTLAGRHLRGMADPKYVSIYFGMFERGVLIVIVRTK